MGRGSETTVVEREDARSEIESRSGARASALGDALDSPVFQAIARAGSLDHDELAYQLEKRGHKLQEGELDRLAEAGQIEIDSDGYSVVIPSPRQRAGGSVKDGDGGNGYTHDEILDRVRLWALIFGRPPSRREWHVSEIRRQMARERVRLEHMERAESLYEAGDWPATTTVVNRFGSMNVALVAAGFAARGPGQQPDVPVVPGKPWSSRKPVYGEEPLNEAHERVREARAAEDEDGLANALIELAMCAFTEADRLQGWDPGPEAVA
jgi:hypothetical protein